MTQTAVNTEQVTALFEERQRYQSWIAALEAKRATTATHIYNRVHADYTARLQRVVEQFATHAAALKELEASLMERISALDIDEAKHRDEAAEVELRAMVGELTPERQHEVAERTRAALEILERDRAQVTEELTRLRTILEAGGIGSEARPATSQQPHPAQATGASTLHTGAVASDDGRAAQDSGSRVDDWQLAFERTPQTRPQNDPGSSALRRPSAELRMDRSAEVGPFDDLEFLKSMSEARLSGESVAVGSALGGTESSSGAGAAPSPERTVGHTASSGAASHESAEPVVVHAVNEAMNPKASMAAEQVKTLKCLECGTLNYPTEWYCERCGAELAAL